MSITIELTPEQEARLREKAQQQNKDLETDVLDAVLQEPEFEYWLRELKSIGIETGVSLPLEATGREALYDDHL